MLNCSKCGKSVPEASKFCPSCGAKIVDRNGNNKVIEKSRIYSIIVVLIIFAGLLLGFSDTFNKPEIKNVQTQTFNDPHSGVNLTQLQELNKLEESLNKNPDNYDIILKLGHLYSDNGFYEKAIAKYDKYINKFPKATDVIVDRGFCYFELRKLDQAMDNFKTALKQNPKHQIANFNLGIILLNTGKKEEAKKYFKIASEINPNTQIGKKAINLLNQ